jgi:hypothetical protein
VSKHFGAQAHLSFQPEADEPLAQNLILLHAVPHAVRELFITEWFFSALGVSFLRRQSLFKIFFIYILTFYITA